MAYYSAIKRKETLPFATTWMSVESIMLNEKRLKDEWFVFSHGFETVDDNLSKVRLGELHQYFF